VRRAPDRLDHLHEITNLEQGFSHALGYHRFLFAPYWRL
jgi:hypothetical protein